MAEPKTFLDEHLFVEGTHEDADRKVLPDGMPTRARNMRVRADGRWGCRHDYVALPTTTNTASPFRAVDVIPYDDRLLARGEAIVSNSGPPMDLFELVEHPTFGWRPTDPISAGQRTGLVSQLRDMGRPPRQQGSVSVFDCAAAQGRAALVWENAIGGTDVHVFSTATDSTLHSERISITRPRVISIGETFFIGGLSGGNVALFRYRPSTDETLVSLGNLFSGAAVTYWDFCEDGRDTTAWAVVLRSGASQIKRIDSSGTVTLTFAGPTTAFSFCAIGQTATRVHLVGTIGGQGILHSFTLAGAAGSGPTVLFGGALIGINAQPAILDTGNDLVGVFAETLDVVNHTVLNETRDALSHAFVLSATWSNGALSARPVAQTNAETFSQVYGGYLQDTGARSNYLGAIMSQTVAAYKDKLAAAPPTESHCPRIAKDVSTGKFYWPNLIDNGEGFAVPLVTEFLLGSSERQQTAQTGGMLYLSGGCPQIFDGRILSEAGFQESPVISAVPTTGGGVPSSTRINVAVTWEWRDAKGNLHTSRPSLVSAVDMGASQNAIQVTSTAPHSLRSNLSYIPSSVSVVAWRSIQGIAQLRRALTTQSFGDNVTFTLGLNDDSIRGNAVIYTQAGRGILSAVEPHEAPVPFDYVWPFASRLLTAGGPNRYQAQVSKLLFPTEPVQWSGAAGFFVRGPDTEINGVAAIGRRGILFTSETLYEFGGDEAGPNDNGEGGYSDASVIPGSTGLRDWRSVVLTPFGLMFQGVDMNIWLLPLDGSQAVPFQQVQDTMQAFPVVTAAVLAPNEQLVSFVCMNAALDDSRIVSFDIQTKVWIIDDFATATPIVSACSYEGRLVYISASACFQERATLAPTAFIDHGMTLGDQKPFGGTGWGEHRTTQFLGEIVGDTNLRLRFSYDSGRTWVNGKTFQCRLSEDPSGSIIRRSWAPVRSKVERFALDFQCLTPGAASAGLIFNGYANELRGVRGSARKPSRQQG